MPPRRTRRAAVFQGHADAKADILRFFRQIDRGVTAVIRDAPAPLVLPTVKYLGVDLSASEYAPVAGRRADRRESRRLSASALHARAWPPVGVDVDPTRRTATARYLALRGTGKGAGDVVSVVAAALDGRVDVLFAACGVQTRAIFPIRTRAVVAAEVASGAL